MIPILLCILKSQGKHEGQQTSYHCHQAGYARTRKSQRPTTYRLEFYIGSSSIVDEETREPLLSVITLIVETAVKLRQDGHRVVIVSSGAIAVGLRRMDVGNKPKHLPRIQVGLLVSIWSNAICETMLMGLQGYGSSRAMSAYQPLG